MNNMPNHLEQIEQELRDLLGKGDANAVVNWVKERVLESYRNGQASRRGVGAQGQRKAYQQAGGARSFKRSYSGARSDGN
jgi:hypothetical protein